MESIRSHNFLFFGTKLIATQNFPFRLSISFLLMLLHLHQSQLDFLISFSRAKSSSVDQSLDCHLDTACSKLARGHAIAKEALLPFFQASHVDFGLCYRYFMRSFWFLAGVPSDFVDLK